MSLIRSAPTDGTPWRDLFSATAVAVAIPFFIGVVLLALFLVARSVLTNGPDLVIWVIAMALILSPLQTVAGMILALPLAAVLIRAGWFGWVPASLLGLSIGGLMGTMIKFEPGAAFGLCVTLILRAVLGRLRQMDEGGAQRPLP